MHLGATPVQPNRQLRQSLPAKLDFGEIPGNYSKTGFKKATCQLKMKSAKLV